MHYGVCQLQFHVVDMNGVCMVCVVCQLQFHGVDMNGVHGLC